MSLKRKIERRQMLAEAKRIQRQREQLGDTTIRVIGLLQASPLESRQAFGVDLFAKDALADRINTAWLIIRGRKTEPLAVIDDVDEHASMHEAGVN